MGQVDAAVMRQTLSLFLSRVEVFHAIGKAVGYLARGDNTTQREAIANSCGRVQ